MLKVIRDFKVKDNNDKANKDTESRDLKRGGIRGIVKNRDRFIKPSIAF